MKRVAFVSLLSLCFLSLTLPASIVADTDGPSAKGSFHVPMDNGQSGVVEFDARVASDGNTTGEITFRADAVDVRDLKAAVDDEESDALPPFYAKASCDCLVVKGIEAALSGTVTESSRKSFIGRRVLVVVQDGDSLTPPLRDKLTFGFYKTPTRGWVATDGERSEEQEPTPGWVASDAERTDDPGVLSQINEVVTCQTFPISAHVFISATQGKGKIQVTR